MTLNDDFPARRELRVSRREKKATLKKLATRNSPLATPSRSKLIIIRLLQELPHVGRLFALLQETTERVVPQLPGDVFQRPQVIARAIGRRNQEKQQVNL